VIFRWKHTKGDALFTKNVIYNKYHNGCNHNPTSQKGRKIAKKHNQNYIYIYIPFKTWQSRQVIDFSFIWMSKNSNQKSIWWNFKLKFWFRTFKSEQHVKYESILQKTIKKTCCCSHLMGRNWEDKDILITLKKHSYPKICEILKF